MLANHKVLASNAFVWQVIHISKRGGCTEGRRGRETEEGRVAAFRTTDTPRGFILSPKIEPYASSPGEKPRRVRASSFAACDASTEATTWIWGRTGPCTLDLSVFFLSEARGVLAWHAVRIYHWPGFENQRQRTAGSCSCIQRAVMLRTCQTSAPGPDCWRRERQLLAKKLPPARLREPAWRVQPSPSSTRITYFFFSFTSLKGRRNGDFGWLSLFPLLSNGYSLQGRPLHRDAP